MPRASLSDVQAIQPQQSGRASLSDIQGYLADRQQENAANTERNIEGQEPASLKDWSAEAGKFGVGALKGMSSTARNLTSFPNLKTGEMYSPVPELTPNGTAENAGYNVERAAEFLAPAGLEEKAAMAAPEAFRPAARIGAGALSGGMVNANQGGSFLAGAGMGAGSSAIGEGLKAMSPALAEASLGIRKTDRAYKAPGTIGKAILNETSGFRPGKVAASAQDLLDELNPQLNQAADRASVRPTPRLLPPPAEEVPLANISDSRNPRMRPMAFPAEVNPEEPMEPRSGNPMAPISEFPGINPHYLSGSEHPELSGRVAQPGGVMFRHPELNPEPPPFVPNTSASLRGARGELGNAFGTAARQGERKTISQLEPMRTHLGEDIGGNPIPENVTPRQLLDLKRGFGNEHVHNWNPETMTGVKGTAGRVYHQMSTEFENAAPEAAPLNRRIGALIPVAKRGESAGLNASLAQRAMHRVAAHTGAGLGAVTGGYSGYQHGGPMGAIAGGAAGLLIPEIVASPTSEMFMARGMHSPLTAPALRLAGGGALQLENKGKKAKNE